MNKIFYFMSLVCVMLLAACSSEDEFVEEENGNPEYGEEIEIGVGMPDDETRVAFDEDGLGLTWEKGDKLLVVACDNNGGLKFNEQGEVLKSEFTIVQGYGKKKAKFRGYLPDNESKYSGNQKYYQVFYNGKLTVKEESYTSTTIKNKYIDIDYTKVEQNGFNSKSHLKDYLFMAVSHLTEGGTSTERRYLPDVLRKENFNKELKLRLLNSYLQIDVRAVPANLKNADEIKWLVNNHSDDNSYSEPMFSYGTLRFNVDEIKDIRNDENQHQYLYLPVRAIPYSHVMNSYYNAIVFSDRYINTRAVSSDGAGKLIKPGGRYKMNVSVRKDGVADEQHTLYDWDGFEADEIPNVKPEEWLEDNQLRVKLELKEGETPFKSLTDDNGVTYKLVEGPGSEGWYKYEADIARIENIDGLIAPEHAERVVGLQLPLHLRTICDGVCRNFHKLKDLYLSPYVQNIGVGSFADCKALDKIVIPYCTRIIQKDAFKGFNGHDIIVRTPEKQLAICASGAFGSSNKTNCTLRLHKSWQKYMKPHDKRWAGYRFKQIIYIDDDGKDLSHPLQ